MKKYISIILIAIVLISALLPNYTYSANNVSTGGAVNSTTTDRPIQTPEIFNQIIENGTATGGSNVTEAVGNNTTVISQSTDRNISLKPSQGGYVAAVLAKFITLLPLTISKMMSVVTYENNIEDYIFTVEDLVLGRIDLFNINYFDLNNPNNTSIINNLFKENVAKWYYNIRTIAIMASLVVMIYIGIRMAISTLADDKAKYKKMLTSWFVSFILIFVLHYIMLIALELCDSMINLFSRFTTNGFEKDLVSELFGTTAKGWNTVIVCIMYFVLVFYQLKFFFMYMKRLIATGFLILIAPLITITYSIDKVQDNKAQAFTAWMKEFMVNVFIQPLHALIFVLFMYSAYELVGVAPIIAVLFLMGLSRAEKVVKTVFDMRGRSSIHAMSDTLKFHRKNK